MPKNHYTVIQQGGHSSSTKKRSSTGRAFLRYQCGKPDQARYQFIDLLMASINCLRAIKILLLMVPKGSFISWAISSYLNPV